MSKRLSATVVKPIPGVQPLHDRIKELREQTKLTAAGFCRTPMPGGKRFVDPRVYGRYEAGERTPDDKFLGRFVYALHVRRVVAAGHRDKVVRELLALKYSGHPSEFVRELVAFALSQPK